MAINFCFILLPFENEQFKRASSSKGIKNKIFVLTSKNHSKGLGALKKFVRRFMVNNGFIYIHFNK